MCASRDYSVMPRLSPLPESRLIQDSFKTPSMAGGAAIRHNGSPREVRRRQVANRCWLDRRQPRRNTRRLIMQLHDTANAQNTSSQHRTTVLAPNDTRRPCGRPRRHRRPEPLGHARGVERRWPSRVHAGDAERAVPVCLFRNASPPAFGVTQPTPSNAAGFNIFNGDGTGTDTVTLTIGGHIVLENVVVPISYTVNADCTGTSRCSCPMGHPSISSSHLMASNSPASQRVLPAIQGRTSVGGCRAGRDSQVSWRRRQDLVAAAVGD